MISFYFLFFCGSFVVDGLPQAFGLRNDEGGKGWYSQTRHCESCLQLVAISVWDTIIYSWNSFYCLFLYLLFVVYGLLRRFTPRNDKETRDSTPPHRHCDYETVITRLCRRSENLVIETTTRNPHRHCEGLKSPWQSQYGVLWQSNKTRHCEGLKSP